MDHLQKILISRCQNSNINPNGSGAAQPLKFLFLEHAQKLRLQLQWHLADFVQENRAAIGKLKTAELLRHGPGKGSSFMTE